MEGFITILYGLKKHSGLVVLLERQKFVPRKFVCLIRERDENLKWFKNIKIKILIWHMVGEIVLKWGRSRFYQGFIPAHYTSLVKIKILHTSAGLNLNYDKNGEGTKTVVLIKTCDQCPLKFNFKHFFSSLIVSPFSARGKKIFKKRCLGEMSNFLLPAGDDKNLAGGFSWRHE